MRVLSWISFFSLCTLYSLLSTLYALPSPLYSLLSTLYSLLLTFYSLLTQQPCQFFKCNVLIAISVHRSCQTARPGAPSTGANTAIKLHQMGPSTMNIVDKVDELLSGVEFMKNKMLKDDCDQMLKEMKKDEEKWKREEYKKVWENIKKSNHFGEVGCGGGLQYILVPNDVQVIAMWNGKVSNENSNKQNEMPDTMFLLWHSNVDITK